MTKDHEITSAEIIAFPGNGRTTKSPAPEQNTDAKPMIFGNSWYHQEAIDESKTTAAVAAVTSEVDGKL